MTGQCLCGATTYSASGEPSAAHACHCDDCQRFSGSVFIGVDFDQVDYNGPVKWFKSSEWGERGSCSACGSAMFWRQQGGQGKTVVSIGSLHDASAIAPIDKHYFADNIPPAFALSGDAVRLSREETFALFQSMTND